MGSKDNSYYEGYDMDFINVYKSTLNRGNTIKRFFELRMYYLYHFFHPESFRRNYNILNVIPRHENYNFNNIQKNNGKEELRKFNENEWSKIFNDINLNEIINRRLNFNADNINRIK